MLDGVHGSKEELEGLKESVLGKKGKCQAPNGDPKTVHERRTKMIQSLELGIRVWMEGEQRGGMTSFVSNKTSFFVVVSD